MVTKTTEGYIAVLDDLNRRKEPLLVQIQEIDTLIGNIKKMMPEGFDFGVARIPKPVPLNCFRNMSMRWGILQYLSDFAVVPIPTAEVAAKLVEGGFSTSPTLNSKVSAILSQMAAKTEVQKEGQEWAISPHGREMWESIQKSEKYLNRHHSSTEVDLD